MVIKKQKITAGVPQEIDIQFSDVTPSAELSDLDGIITLSAHGPVKGIQFNYKYNCNFKNLLGPGYLLSAANGKLLMVGLAGNFIGGDILKFSGKLKIKN